MLKSMTGYGKAVCETKTKKFTIEIKSLNSKQLDLNARIPSLFKEKELEIRNEINRILERGKIDFSIYSESLGEEKTMAINSAIVKSYFYQLQSIASDLNINCPEALLQMALKMPDTLKQEYQELDIEEWKIVFEASLSAMQKVDEFRKQEGSILEKDMIARIQLIADYLKQVEVYEKTRLEQVKERIKTNISEFIQQESIDHNRFEQELIYYIEKLDITEEKVRLKKHCEYFIETIKEQVAVGKKLGFVTQEIGREINTLGSKANHAEIQKLVIKMKDELEKIKEQLLNIL